MTPQLNVIEVVVTQMERSLAFYRRLGLPIPEGLDDAPHAEVELAGGIKLAFDTVEVIKSFDPDWTPPAGGHGQALAFGCADPAEVDATFADLVEAGGSPHLEPWDAFWGMRYAVVHDPDGHTVDLYALLPETRTKARPRPKGRRTTAADRSPTEWPEPGSPKPVGPGIDPPGKAQPRVRRRWVARCGRAASAPSRSTLLAS